MSHTTSDVVDTLNSALDTVETETSDLAGGVRAVVSAEEAGSLYRELRTSGFEFESKRDPSGDNIVVNIEAEEERGLGDLFR